jgi:SAM-dependent methyltransferase
VNYDHSVVDYRSLVKSLIATHPLEEAMSIAVGGDYHRIGEIEKKILVDAGLEPQHHILDIGCGSGRLAKALISYLDHDGCYYGTDVVQEMLDYACRNCPLEWFFICLDDSSVPFPAQSFDFVCFFSVFTHLLPEESYGYLLEAKSVLKPGGKIVFSFLEYDTNWPVFESTFAAYRNGKPAPHLNTFLGRDAIEAWATNLGFDWVWLEGADKEGLGQSVCILRKPQ